MMLLQRITDVNVILAPPIPELFASATDLNKTGLGSQQYSPVFEKIEIHISVMDVIVLKKRLRIAYIYNIFGDKSIL